MATRALVGFITDGPELISTYNHYDGYPENLGVGLDNHYSTPEEALKIASTGYISYMDPETGEIDAKYKEPAERTDLDMDFDDAMLKIAGVADSYGADYVYIYDIVNSEWVNVKMYGVRQTGETLENLLRDLQGNIFGPSLDEVNETFETKWKKFLNENEVSKVMSQAFFKLQDEPKEMLDAYKKSLTNDIRLNGQEQYADYSVEDFIEDYENYIADKMDS